MMKLNPGNYSETIQRLLKDAGGTGTVTRTTYSVKVETVRGKYLLSDGGMPGKCFGVARKLRKEAGQRRTDIGGVDHWGTLPGADRHGARYYRFSGTVLPPDAVCVDISAAYPSTMALGGVVSPDAVATVMALPKPHRLKVVGMLATRRYTSNYQGGRSTGEVVTEEPTARAFFALCRKVGEVMDGAAVMAGADFLLYWVDGAFIRRSAAPAFAALLEAHGYATTSSEITDIALSRSGRFIRYRKDGKATYLCVPSKKTAPIPDELC